uniref:CKLF like MARVEL transmembrane domain containing 3 n=1 Tax=Macaca nemestrina TaxID=9545 RepID=A0A2K6BAZ6_MACNE
PDDGPEPAAAGGGRLTGARASLLSPKRPSSLPAPGLSFITFICYVASSASAFLTAPLLEFLLALFFLFADAMQLNDKWQGLCWPMMVFGFFATIVFAIDFYLIFNDVAKFLKQGDSADETTAHKTEEENSDSDSD